MANRGVTSRGPMSATFREELPFVEQQRDIQDWHAFQCIEMSTGIIILGSLRIVLEQHLQE